MDRIIRFFCILSCIYSSILVLQAHDHENIKEPAHYKYSREANEPVHGHTHGGGGCPYAHGHSHNHDEITHGHTHSGHNEHSHEDPNVHSHAFHQQSHEDDHVHSRDESVHGHPHSDDHRISKLSVPRLQKSGTPYDPNGYFNFLNDARIRIWVYSMGSTFLISVAPFLILSVIPLQSNDEENEPLLKVLLSFGSGGLLGDAFLHLIPHARPSNEGFTVHSHSHSHVTDGHSHEPHDMSVGGCVLAGIIAFLIVEKLVRIIRCEGEEHSHPNGHSHNGDVWSDKSKNEKEMKLSVSSNEEDESNHSDCQEPLVKSKSHTGFKVAAYLNLAADFTHNFTDGLAIGASYLAGTTIGVVTTITVLVHEVPHEIGDFAILVQSGFSKRKAMLVQLLTAMGALTGCGLALWTADAYAVADAASSSWVLPFTAGGFIYIATVSVIPELLHNSSVWQSIKEVFALLSGILLMYLIALYE